MEEYMVELGGYEYAVQAASPEEARQKGLLAHVKSVGQQSVEQAVGDAEKKREDALANAPMSPWTEAALAGMSGEGGAFADPNATGEDIIKRGAGMATTAGAVGLGTGLVAAPAATIKAAIGSLGGSIAGNEAGQWAGRRLPFGLGGETASSVLGGIGSVAGGGIGGYAGPKVPFKELLSRLTTGGGSKGLLSTVLGGGESAAAKGAATQAAKTVAPEVARKAELDIAIKEARLAKIAAAEERAKELHAARLAKASGAAPKAPKADPKPVPKPVPEPAPAPPTEGATALKPEPEFIDESAVSLVAEPLPFKPRGTTKPATNLGGKAKPGPAPTPPDKLEETLRASLDDIAEKKASKAALEAIAEKVEASPLQVPRIQIGAQRVGRQVGMTKEQVRQQAGPVLDEARGEASPILPIEPFKKIIDTMKAIPPAEREAYVARATSGKAKWQIENIRRTLEHLGLLVPVGAGVAATASD